MKEFLLILLRIYRILLIILAIAVGVLSLMIIVEIADNSQWMWGLFVSIPAVLAAGAYFEEKS